jgi:capsular polysaccharide biosynthesis protein
MTEKQDPQRPASTDALDERLALQLGAFEQERLSRTSLENMIRSLDLYKSERQRMPMEDVAEQMRRDLQFRWKAKPSPYAGEPAWAVSISFAYPDKEKARVVVNRLVTGLAEENRQFNRIRELAWQQIWSISAPPGETVEVLDQASLPTNPVAPNRVAFVACGLGAGMLLGLLTAFVMLRTRWTLTIAAFAAASCAIGVAVSFLIPETYTSSAVMLVTQPLAPERLSGPQPITPPAKRIQQMQREILSHTSLEKIIQGGSAGGLAAGVPRETVEKIRRDISIQMLNPPGAPRGSPAFQISFTYPGRKKAQAVVRALITEFTERNVRERARAKESGDAKALEIEEHKVGLNFEVLDPASLPEKPIAPNRLLIAAAGLALGLLLGILTLWLPPKLSPFLRSVRSLNSGTRKTPQPPEPLRRLALGH